MVGVGWGERWHVLRPEPVGAEHRTSASVLWGEDIHPPSPPASPTFGGQVLRALAVRVTRRDVSGTEAGFAPDAAKLVPELRVGHTRFTGDGGATPESRARAFPLPHTRTGQCQPPLLR